MSRIYYTDLPDETYPIIASRTNGLLNGEESIEKIVAGSIEGKNLFDKNNANILNAYFNTSTTTITSNDSNRVVFIKCNANATYTFSKLKGSVFSIGYTTTLPTIGATVSGIIDGTVGTYDGTTRVSGTITTGANAQYLVCRIIQTANDGANANIIFNSLQIETGSTATDYVPYMKYGYNEDTNMGKLIVEKISGKNLCNGINQNYFLFQSVNSCGKSTGDIGLAIEINETPKFTISTLKSQARYRIACTNSLPATSSDSVTAYNGVNKDGTSDSVTINTSGYKYLIVNATDLTSIQIEKGTEATSYQDFNTTQMGNVVVDDILPTNLIPFEAVTTTSKGVTFTANSDKSVTINGTATAQTDFTIGNVSLKAGQQYYLSGAKGGSANTWFLNIQGVGNDSGNGFIYTPAQDETRRIFIRVKNGVTVNNAKCTPKLNKGSSCNPFDNSESEVYSTNEIKIGRWINGKPLYRKVIQFTSPSDNNFHEISTGSFDNIFIETFFLNIPVDNKIEKYLTLTNAYSLYSVDNSLRLKYLLDTEFYKNRPMTVIIKYTKTTD